MKKMLNLCNLIKYKEIKLFIITKKNKTSKYKIYY